MPTFGNITIKKADGTTDVVYTGIARSGGDNNPTRYRSETVGTVPAQKPVFAIVCGPGPNSSRKAVFNGKFPYYDIDGKERGSVILRNAEVIVSQGISTSEINEGVYQLLNLAASSAAKQTAAEGYAPT